MQTKQKILQITPVEISTLLKTHYYSLMASFYETQNLFLKEIYKRYGSIETANIMGCFKKNVHLAILRERENSLNFDLSLNKFWSNYQAISMPIEKISSIVEITNIPKETVRRKIKNLINTGFILNDKNSKGYTWNLSQKRKDSYFENVNNEIKSNHRPSITLSNSGKNSSVIFSDIFFRDWFAASRFELKSLP